MYKKHLVKLTDEQRRVLLKLISTRKKASARNLTRARILLRADSGPGRAQWTDEQISVALDVSTATVERVRALFSEVGLDAVLEVSKPQRHYQSKLDAEAKALLRVLYYTDPPDGRVRWTMGLLAEKLAEYGYPDELSRETIRKALKESEFNV